MAKEIDKSTLKIIPGSPYDLKGYFEDSKFKHVRPNGWFGVGETIWLYRDDNSSAPQFTNGYKEAYVDLNQPWLELIKEEPAENINLATVFTPLQKGDSFKIKSDWDDGPQDNWYCAGEHYTVVKYLPHEKAYRVTGGRLRPIEVDTCWVGEDAIDFDTVVKAGVADTEAPWIEWYGGKPPVTDGTLVEVKYRDGGTSIVTSGLNDRDKGFKRVEGVYHATRWSHYRGDPMNSDIVAYRLYSDAPVASPSKQEDVLKEEPSASIGNKEKAVVEAVGSPKMVEISSQHTLTIKGKVVGVFSTEELLLIQQEIMNYE